jgi:hypothetical protein
VTTPTQAQIEAAARAIAIAKGYAPDWWDRSPNNHMEFLELAKAALTAAAQVGEPGGYGLKPGDPRLDEVIGGPQKPKLTRAQELGLQMRADTTFTKSRLDAATIERCAQVAKKYIDDLTDHKSEFMKKWDELRHQVEKYKGSDLPRLNFESIIETIAEDTEAAIRKLKDEP